MNLEFAQRWAYNLGNDVEALGAMYAPWFTSEHTMIDDNMADTITDGAMLAEQYGGYSSGENGSYTFSATEWLGGRSDFGLIHWDVKIEGARSFRGLPVPDGQTLEGIGSTFQRYDADGRISFESTYWEDNRIFVQLGVPLLRPHYWKEDFDMEAFLASAAG